MLKIVACCANARPPPLLRSRQRPAPAAPGMGAWHCVSLKRCTCSDGYHNVEGKLWCWRRKDNRMFQSSCVRKVSNDGTTMIQKVVWSWTENISKELKNLQHPTEFDLLVCHDAIQQINSSVQLHRNDFCDHNIVNRENVQLNFIIPQLDLLMNLFRWLALLPKNSSTQVNCEICTSAKNWLKIEWEEDRNHTLMEWNR
jgi:hypothetical protein